MQIVLPENIIGRYRIDCSFDALGRMPYHTCSTSRRTGRALLPPSDGLYLVSSRLGLCTQPHNLCIRKGLRARPLIAMMCKAGGLEQCVVCLDAGAGECGRHREGRVPGIACASCAGILVLIRAPASHAPVAAASARAAAAAIAAASTGIAAASARAAAAGAAASSAVRGPGAAHMISVCMMYQAQPAWYHPLLIQVSAARLGRMGTHARLQSGPRRRRCVQKQGTSPISADGPLL